MPSFGHDNDAYLLGRMVDMLTEELEVSVEGGDTTTHKREDLGKGAEPDKCYWFGDNARHMRGKRQLDLNRDPAPDLVIEVDVTRTSLDRLEDLRRDGGAGGLAVHQPISPVPPSCRRTGLISRGRPAGTSPPCTPRRSPSSSRRGGPPTRRPGSGPSGPSSARRSFPVSGRTDGDRSKIRVADRPALTIGTHPRRSSRACDPAGTARGPAAAVGPAPGRRRARRWPARAASRRACGRWRRSGSRSREPSRCRGGCRCSPAAGRPRSPRPRPRPRIGQSRRASSSRSRAACAVGRVSKPASSSVAPTRIRPSSRGTR